MEMCFFGGDICELQRYLSSNYVDTHAEKLFQDCFAANFKVNISLQHMPNMHT